MSPKTATKEVPMSQVEPRYFTAMLNVVTAAQLYVNRGPRTKGAWERLFDSVKALDEFEHGAIEGPTDDP